MLSRSPARGAAALVLFAALAGCASTSPVPQYAASGTDTARLRVALGKGTIPRSGAGDGMTAFLHTTEDCASSSALASVYTLDNGPADHTPDRRDHRKAGKLGMPLGEYDRLEVEELLVEAGEDKNIALQFSVLLAGPLGAFTRCNIALEQDFVAGRDYEIVGRFDSVNSCSAVINELVTEAGGATRKQIATVNSRVNPLSPACFVKY
jgi:hypothetical protein